MAIIQITDLTLNTIIGTNSWERTTKQKVVINITLEYNSTQAVAGDDLTKAVDYKSITKKIIAGVKKSRFFLLEKLTAYVLKILIETPGVNEATVRIDKPKALRFSKSVSVELSSRH